MGLFKKKLAVDPVEFLALQAELAEVRTRLDAAEQGKVYLEARVGSLDATTTALTSNTSSKSEQLESQLTVIADQLHTAQESRANRPPAPDAVEILEPKLVELSSRIEAVAGQMAGQVAGQAAAPAPTPADPAVAARLEQVEASAGTVTQIAQRLDQLHGRVEAQADVQHEIEVLNERIGQLQAHAGEADEVRRRVERLAETVDAAESARTARSEGSSISTEAIAAQVAQLAERVSISANDARTAKEHVAALDARVASVGTELANQLSELGQEIDALAERQLAGAEPATTAPVAEVSPEVFEAIRAGQKRLANEQARYEIAFREDLATLAEQVRHLRGR